MTVSRLRSHFLLLRVDKFGDADSEVADSTGQSELRKPSSIRQLEDQALGSLRRADAPMSPWKVRPRHLLSQYQSSFPATRHRLPDG